MHRQCALITVQAELPDLLDALEGSSPTAAVPEGAGSEVFFGGGVMLRCKVLCTGGCVRVAMKGRAHALI